MILALSAGHNISEQGAVSHMFHRTEWEMAKEVNLLVEEMLSGTGIELHLVKGQSLKEKVEDINRVKADFALETHFNSAYDYAACGFETLCYPGSRKGELLAETLLESFNEYLPFRNRGMKLRGDLYFLRATNCPSVIIEPWFISNDEEMIFVEKYPRGAHVLARAIVRGVQAYKACSTKQRKVNRNVELNMETPYYGCIRP